MTSGPVMVIICCFSSVFERYKSYSPYDMLESIKKEVKGDLENAFLNLGTYVRSPSLVDLSFLCWSRRNK